MKILFAGSECYPFVKTGGLADVMGALPKALQAAGHDVRVILPNYSCIPQTYKENMRYMTHFYMDIGVTQGAYVGLLTLELEGITYYFIDNESYFSHGDPYADMADDVGRFAFFDKAVLAAMPVVDFYPDVIHCHDWQAGLIPVYLRTLFQDTRLARGAKSVLTIHNLRFQGIHSVDYLRNATGLPGHVFTVDGAVHNGNGNMMKGGIVYADWVTTVSETYAQEIMTPEYGEGLDGLLSFYHGKVSGIVNGIDNAVYDPATDEKIARKYDPRRVIAGKKANKLALQAELGLEQDGDKLVIGLISRLTDQKGLDLLGAVLEPLLDPYTQFVLLGTGEPGYEALFRRYEEDHKGQASCSILYSDERSRKIYAGADILLVPSRFEPCGLTQLMAQRYGALPLVRETGGLRDTVEPYNEFDQTGSGFSFDRYDAGLLLQSIDYAKKIYFTCRKDWDAMVRRVVKLDNSWANSAQRYIALYEGLVG